MSGIFAGIRLPTSGAREARGRADQRIGLVEAAGRRGSDRRRRAGRGAGSRRDRSLPGRGSASPVLRGGPSCRHAQTILLVQRLPADQLGPVLRSCHPVVDSDAVALVHALAANHDRAVFSRGHPRRAARSLRCPPPRQAAPRRAGRRGRQGGDMRSSRSSAPSPFVRHAEHAPQRKRSRLLVWVGSEPHVFLVETSLDGKRRARWQRVEVRKSHRWTCLPG
jgi:hypothetical protein